MNKEIKSKLEQYVEGQINNLNSIDKGEDGFLGKEAEAIKNINILVELLQKDEVNENSHTINVKKIDMEDNKNITQHDLELDKLDLEKKKLGINQDIEIDKLQASVNKNNDDSRLKEMELNDNIKNRKKEIVISTIKIGVEIMAVALPIMQYHSWMKRGFEFEETGTFTSNTFKNMFSKFKPCK